MKNWADMKEREDLMAIPRMAQLRFKTIFYHLDQMHKRNNPMNPPQHAVSFTNGRMIVWMTPTGWTVARNDKGVLRDHDKFDTIEEVIINF